MDHAGDDRRSGDFGRDRGGVKGEGRGNMTLVYAAAVPDIGFMVSDTLLEPLIEIKRNPTGPVNGQFHALKVQILNGKTAVAFSTSNDAAAALAIISRSKEQLRADPNLDVPNSILTAYADAIKNCRGSAVPDCEFLVLRLSGSGKKLSRVTKDAITNIERGYIGDANAYARLMELKKPIPAPAFEHVQLPDGSFVTRPLTRTDGEIKFEEIAVAMEALTQERKIDGVGAVAGCVLRVVDARISGGLEYLQSGEKSNSPWEAEAGFTFLASNTEPRGMGLYWPGGKVGFVFTVGESEGCIKEIADDVQTFIANAEKKYGLKLTGVT